jgi:tellurite methyltransferase
MQDLSMEREWPSYYAATEGRPPRETLVYALDRFEREGRAGATSLAVDLGCGNGRDTVELLRRGWRVLAIDAEPAAIEMLEGRLGSGRPRDGGLRDGLPGLPPILSTRVARFEDADWPPADLVNASFSLPLCPPDAFAATWARIVASLTKGGRFAGQFFGDRDGLAGSPGVTLVTRDEAEALLRPLSVELFREEEEDSVTPRGRPKHWHIFHVVARRD